MEGESPTRKIAYVFYMMIFFLGIAMYVAWGILYNSWNLFQPENVGVYAIVAIMVGFGITGMLLYSR